MVKIKKISIVLLVIGLVISLAYSIFLNYKYDTNEQILKTQSDSLCTIIELKSNKYDSLKIHSDSIYQYELNRSDSLYQLLQTNQKTNKNKITYIYRDSIIIKEVENTEIDTKVETKYVDKIVEKEVIKTIHDTIEVTKTDTIYQESKTEVKTLIEENKKEVVVKEDLFNLYLDANVKGNLGLDIVPEANLGIMIKEKYYGEIGIDYDKGKVNPNARLGIKLNIF